MSSHAASSPFATSESRPAPSPAQGSASFHKQEHAGIVRAAFESVEQDLEEAEYGRGGDAGPRPQPERLKPVESLEKEVLPVAAEIHVPELGESVADATVGRWLKQEGEAVKSGEALVELETDKINFEVEAEQDGVLESISKGEGETVGVGEVIGTIGEGEADGAGSELPPKNPRRRKPQRKPHKRIGRRPSSPSPRTPPTRTATGRSRTGSGPRPPSGSWPRSTRSTSQRSRGAARAGALRARTWSV